MWHRLPEQQQRGVQIGRVPKDAPKDAVEDRAAQDHEQAGGDPGPGHYPSDPIERRQGDENTPDAPAPHVDWDERVQPERADEREHERQGD
jgi:hypothetical protein